MNSINKELLRKILKNKARFLYLMMITLLGSSTYIALNILPESMNKTIINIYNKYNIYDIKIFNNLGFDGKDKEILNNIKNIDDIEYVYNKEYFLNEKEVINLFSLPKNITKLNIIEGQKPINKNELIIEYRLKKLYPINSYIMIDNKKYIISGYFENPIHRLLDNHEIAYIGLNRSDILAYTVQSNFEDSDLKNVYIKVKKNTDITNLKNIIEQKLYSYNKIENFRKEKLSPVLLEENNILNGKEKIENGIISIYNKKNMLNDINKNLLNKEKIIKDAKNKLDKNEKLIYSKKVEIKKASIDIENAIKKLKDALVELNYGIYSLKESLNKIDEGLNKINDKENELKLNLDKINNTPTSIFFSDNKKKKYIEEINDGLNKIIKEKENLLNNKKELNLKLSELNLKNDEINTNILELEKKREELFIGNIDINKNEEKLSKEKYDFINNYDKNIQKLNKGKEELKKSYKILKNKEKEINQKKIEFEKNNYLEQIKKIKDKIYSLDNVYIVSTYMDNASYISYIEGIESLNIISKIFPIIFYFIVIFITITSMTRLIEEDRNNIGTLRFLGYSDNYILMKYLTYALIPTIIGLIIGDILGFSYLPRFIYSAYNSGSITTFNNLEFIFIFKLFIISLIASFLSSLISVYVSIKSSLNVSVSSLLKMKTPVKGGKIFFEKISYIWNKFKFTTKITIRNIFRYKMKLIINIIGIAGCSSLIFLAFAIKDSFSNIPNYQFEYLRPYKSEINLSNNYNKNNIEKVLKGNKYIYAQKIYSKILIDNKERYTDIYIFDDNIDNFIKVLDKNNNNIKLEDKGIYINQRALELLNKNFKDNILAKDYYNNKYILNVHNSFENFSGNYIYMTKNYYESLGYKYKENIVLVHDEIKNYSDFFKLSDILYIYETNTQKLVYNKISNSLNYIVLFITVFSASLSFIVTYSLLDININERKKEISTIKVLGFRKKEIFKYIYSETIILTIIASILGIFLGIVLHKSILYSMRNTNVVFVENISIKTYILTTILTYIFSFISIVISFRKINKINMVESLKIED